MHIIETFRGEKKKVGHRGEVEPTPRGTAQTRKGAKKMWWGLWKMQKAGVGD